ncbi:hypothetical protein GCM10011408_40180 [Dyella caseinilytica]|nr:hypothetical protein GCM10011408_40180 [Dyella caseinilytica]
MAALLVLKDVTVDSGTELRTCCTARSTTDNAIDDHTSNATQNRTDGTCKQADFYPSYRQSHTTGRTRDRPDGTAQSPCEIARLNLR